jgi:hypothetical protein
VGNVSNLRITLLGVDQIRPTEATNSTRVSSIASALSSAGVWTQPLLVDNVAYAIMDGHHRYSAAQQIGLKAVPAVLVSYDDNRVHLEAWRPGESYTPERVRAIARSGVLLPEKSTRHVIDFPLPACRVALDELKNPDSFGRQVDPANPQPSRAQLLRPCYLSIGRNLGIATPAAASTDVETAETQVPHTHLRQMLQVDPALAALLPAASGRIALGDVGHAPFFLRTTGLMLLPPTLLEDPAALAIAARWGLEASHAKNLCAAVGERWLTAILRHGAAILSAAPQSARDLMLDTLPTEIGRELLADQGRRPSSTLLAWQAEKIEGAAPPAAQGEEHPLLALEAPVEQLLISGGDSRLPLDPRTGFNKYGVPPRPRPEAVHFSSSTASAISDYGFMYCDILRRDLLTSVVQDGTSEAKLARRAVDATGRALCALLGLAEGAADVAIAPSGTDVELLTVMLALAGAGDRPLTNLLISPEETGRGVKFAAAGRYFDDVAATGAPIRKDAAVWPGAAIEVREIAIRGRNGAPRAIRELDEEFIRVGAEALAAGGHVLAHILASSKTGLSAPSCQAVETLVRLAPDRVDVAVDACQMRSAFEDVGALVERGWMVQISGSKFLTGPPFSGALVAPAHLRARVDGAAALLSAAPGIGRAEDWTRWWAERLPRHESLPPPSFGPVFRWLPAILEAQLLASLPKEFRRWAFEQFRSAIADRLGSSRWLQPIDLGQAPDNAPDALSRLSIVSFQVLGQREDGSLSPLDEPCCRAIFELLNVNAADRLGELSGAERAMAAQQSHIGQPVALMTEQGPIAVLRMVLGARFFSIVGYAGAGSIEAALQSEISDALRAIGKLELLASRWWRLAQK